jgi:hypothetical protein
MDWDSVRVPEQLEACANVMLVVQAVEQPLASVTVAV